MALVPSVPSLWRDWWEDFDRPHRLLDINFRRALRRDDFFDTLWPQPFDWYFRPWNRLIEQRVTVSSSTTTTTNVATDDSKFCVLVDVKQFSPHEILVKTIGNSIIVEAKHEECKFGDGHTTTEIMRRYELPKTHDMNGVMANLSTDGVLTITAPKIPVPGPCARIIPVDRLCCKAIRS